MELKQFVTDTLTEIVDGVKEAQTKCLSCSTINSPSSRHADVQAQLVEFDIALASSDDTKTKGGIGVFLGTVVLGSQGESGTSATSHSRIKFSVSVMFPKPPSL